jgi:hypothetical protein
VVPRRDNQQWKDACREVGVGGDEIKEASKDFHDEKRAYGQRGHMPYGKLIIWLRAWSGD